jgi:hypothetical protein
MRRLGGCGLAIVPSVVGVGLVEGNEGVGLEMRFRLSSLLSPVPECEGPGAPGIVLAV